MQRAGIAMALYLFGCNLAAASEPDASTRTAEIPILEEILVEAPEPRYVAPTLRDRIGRVWAPVMINGQGPFRLVLDTGATSSAIVSKVAEQLGIPVAAQSTKLNGVTGSAMVPYVVAKRLEVGDLLINDAKLPIVPAVFGGAEGVLGTQGLTDKRIHIDFARDRIEIEYSRAKRRPVGFTVLHFDVARGRLAQLKLSVGGVRTTAIIDTGAESTVGNASLRDALLLRRRQSQEAKIIGVTLDVTHGESIRIPSVSLNGLEIRNLNITFADTYIFEYWKLTQEPALLLGMDVIGSLETVIIDYKRRELHLRPRS